MPPPTLKLIDERVLASNLIDTLLAAHHRRRPDLPYPESHSDMTWAVYGLLEMFEVKRRPLAARLVFEGDK